MLPVYQLISRTLYNIPIGAKYFQSRDDYALQIYGIVVCIGMYIYSLQVANMNLHFTNVKRNLINHYTVNKLSTQHIYRVSQDSRIF